MTLEEARDAINQIVIYDDGFGKREQGVITSVNESYVFVRYGLGTTSAATAPRDLQLLAGCRS